MGGPSLIRRHWFINPVPGEIRIRCSYERCGKEVERFTVQLELHHKAEWLPVMRFDNAHGFCHRDTLHPDGTQEKTPVYVGGANETFTYAIEDLRTNWQTYRDVYLKEMRS